MSQSISLYELTNLIKKSLKLSFNEPFWIIAEISELKVNSSGHCYLEFIEKDTESNEIIAKTRATIWSYTYRMLKPYFETTTGYLLEEGLKVLINASVEFHELYGFSLNVKDIDPAYTLGDIEKQRRETLLQLEEEGVIEMNKELFLPRIAQKIAIISSATAAGYEDFINQLQSNTSGFKFYTKLFPSIMQGIQAEQSIIAALEAIYAHEEFFDLVVIIRGGGSQSDLSCFDKYNLASNIAQFPLPILTGIGHEKDISITDIVAHTKLKTPTAVAEFLISRLEIEENELKEMENSLIQNTKDILNKQLNRLQFAASGLPSTVLLKLGRSSQKLQGLKQELIQNANRNVFHKKNSLANYTTEINSSLKFLSVQKINQLQNTQRRIRNSSTKILNNTQHQLEKYLLTVNLLDPKKVMKRGYSIVLQDGLLIKDSKEIKDKAFEINFYKGKIFARKTDK